MNYKILLLILLLPSSVIAFSGNYYSLTVPEGWTFSEKMYGTDAIVHEKVIHNRNPNSILFFTYKKDLSKIDIFEFLTKDNKKFGKKYTDFKVLDKMNLKQNIKCTYNEYLNPMKYSLLTCIKLNKSQYHYILFQSKQVEFKKHKKTILKTIESISVR